MLKLCPGPVGCGRELETDDRTFYKQSRAKDGWDTYCKDCRYQWRVARRGQHPVKLINLQGPAMTNEQRREATLLEQMHCRVFVSNGRQVVRFGKPHFGYTPLDEWLEKFEGKFDEVSV